MNNTESSKKKVYLAHVRESDKETQKLYDHLCGTAKRAGKYAGEAGFYKLGELAGWLHDDGKATDEFYNYIRSGSGLLRPGENGYVNPKKEKGKIDHAAAGAALIWGRCCKKDAANICLYQIAALASISHHTGLIDCIEPGGKNNFFERMSKNNFFKEAVENLEETEKSAIDEIVSDERFEAEFKQNLEALQKVEYSKNMVLQMGFIEKFILSCLIDADRLDTAEFDKPDKEKIRNDGNYVSWDILSERLENELAKYNVGNDAKSEINHLRCKISDECKTAARKPRGLYVLNVPTGGGKTLSSMRFAINHANAQKTKMSRIIYVVPFTTIIDQNAQKARDILEPYDERGQVVLEHHSNLTPDEETERNKLLSENWDAPIVFTTMVQFLDAFFGHGTSSIRRLHRMANAVLIFDEIQALPIKCVYLFNAAVKNLVNVLNSTVVLCTATQPLLDEVEKIKALTIKPEQHIITDEKGLSEHMKRCTVTDKCRPEGYTCEETAELVLDELNDSGSVLAIVNTRASAAKLFDAIGKVDCADVFYLSTNMCPAHRMAVLEKIRNNLNPETFKKTICVSTQLIEAGVDIDFGSVIRYLAGLDSVAQAAGRCNRNGKRPRGMVTIINPSNEKLDRLKDISIGADKARRVLGEFKDNPDVFGNDIIGFDTIKQYYRYYFHERQDEMGYVIKGKESTMYELLSDNPHAVNDYKRINKVEPPIVMCQSFKTAAENFTAIDAPTRGVIVYYGEGENIILKLCAEQNPEEVRKLLRRAQRYSINLYSYEFERLCKQQHIHEAQKGLGVFYLDKECYSGERGLSNGEMDFLNA